MGKVKWRGIRLEGEKVLRLMYTNDIVLFAEDERSMRSMLWRLEEYLDRKGLVLNTRKTKVMRFRRGGGRIKKARWFWKGRVIEEVREFKYLGYRFQRNGG